MNQSSISIPKSPVLMPSEDFYLLRREGIGFIEQMGSQLWTDYNIHDPGITILEALCYVLTDYAYRLSWNIEDILTKSDALPDQPPFPDQSFFTARTILTNNPVTIEDYRRLLIDLEGIRNSWIFAKECACELHHYAWCELNELHFSYQKPLNPSLSVSKVAPKGLYGVLLELESDPELGDLNDFKISHAITLYEADGKPNVVTLELRFPDWKLQKYEEWNYFLERADAFSNTNGESFTLSTQVFRFNSTVSITDQSLKDNWRNLFSVNFSFVFEPGSTPLVIENATLRIYSNSTARNLLSANDLLTVLSEISVTGIIHKYYHKLLKIEEFVEKAKKSLHAHRNLDEDYCTVNVVSVEDVAVCADIEVAPEADIEKVQANIWFEIATYFNPPVHFYSLNDLTEKGIPVEDIFNGPELTNGFIDASELENATLKSVLRTSDIINKLMDIEGVISVNNLMLSKYDAQGNVIKGAADPTWSGSTPVFDPNKASASWLLYMTELHQPRLYLQVSRFLFYKKGLQFLARADEANDTLLQLQGQSAKPRLIDTENDLPVPRGTFRGTDEYVPVQYNFPMTYGTGPEGVPSPVTPLRRAQAKQLKGFLMPFEQLLGNSFTQIAHSSDLFSLNPAVQRSYFTKEFTEESLIGYTELENGITSAVVESLTESETEFYERRNRFLDHLLARFGEQFKEYTLLLTDLQGKHTGLKHLIEDKIAFLKAFPTISHNRAKAFNYKVEPLLPGNISGLKRRTSLLLGFPDLFFEWTISGSAPYLLSAFLLKDLTGKIWLEGTVSLSDPDLYLLEQAAYRQITTQLIFPSAYFIQPAGAQYQVHVRDKFSNPFAHSLQLFETSTAAIDYVNELLSWAGNERSIVVEHLLLRPKFPGDALFPACSEGTCVTCGDEDPYSFRLTMVMAGWTSPFNTNLEMRKFADRTIREETPSHLLAKICWVGNDGFIENPCDPVVGEIAGLLELKGLTQENMHPTQVQACECALALYTAFTSVFRNWYEDKTLQYIQKEALKAQLETLFIIQISPAVVSCSTVLSDALWTEIKALFVTHFVEIAFYGWQFERFEQAWEQWVTANAGFDWTKEHIQDQVEAILFANLKTPGTLSGYQKELLCKCASSIATKFGTAFFHWMETNIAKGNVLDQNFTPFTPEAITLCTTLAFKPDTATIIDKILKKAYASYEDVSYKLWILVSLLQKLKNTYPAATLHDCDDGSDQNPVRLGSTALGNYQLNRSISTDIELTTPPEILPSAITQETKIKSGKRRKPTEPPL